MPLPIVERKRLRALAHSLKPVILVGDAGLSEGVLAETDRALTHHELIKVRLPAGDREARAEMAEALCEKLGAERVQAIGRMTVLYRPGPEKEKPAAPAAKKRPRKRPGKRPQRRTQR